MKKLTGLICLAICLSLFVVNQTIRNNTVAQAAGTVVRVAGFVDKGNHLRLEGGTYVGFDAELLKDVAKKADLQIQYVPVNSLQEALEGIRKGTVDVVTNAVRNPQRESEFEFTKNDSGVGCSTMLILSSRRQEFENMQRLDNISIGANANSGSYLVYLQWINKHFPNSKQIAYKGGKLLRQALLNKEVDAIIVDADVIPDTMIQVRRLDYSQEYFLAAKTQKPLLDKIDRALEELRAEKPTYFIRLQQKHFPFIYNESFTQAELDYIDTKPTVKVAIPQNRRPIGWLTSENEYKGILVEAMRRLNMHTGLSIQYVPLPPNIPTTKFLDSAEPNCFTSILKRPDLKDKFYQSANLYEVAISIAGLKGNSLPPSDKLRVGIVREIEGIKDAVFNVFPKAEIKLYSSQDEGLAGLKKKEIDVMANTSFVWRYLRQKPAFDDVVIIETIDTMGNIALGAKKTSVDPLLMQVLDKGIRQFDSDHTKIINNKYSTELLYQDTLSDHLVANWKLITAVLMVFALICFILVQRLRFYRKMAAQNDELRKAMNARSDFLSRVSHDIRTPMNAIVGLTVLMQKEPNLTADAQTYLQKLFYASHYMLNLINDILDVSRIDSGKLTLHEEVVDGPKFLEGIAELYRNASKDKQIQLITDFTQAQTKWVIMDRVRTQQIYSNILSNAIKFSPKGSTVTWKIVDKAINPQKMSMVSSITDQGRGISPEFLPRVFLPFEQERQSSGEESGTGLGLSIVKSLVEKMGGTISVASTLGKGTTFTITMERQIAENGPEDADEKAVANDNSILIGKKVLVVDDQPVNILILSKILTKEKLLVETATNGLEAVEKVKNSPPGYFDYILMDIRMPVLDGLAATKQIRQLERSDVKDLIIIAFTANAFSEDYHLSYESGLNGHLAKPIDTKLLFATLRKFV